MNKKIIIIALLLTLIIFMAAPIISGPAGVCWCCFWNGSFFSCMITTPGAYHCILEVFNKCTLEGPGCVYQI